MTFNLIFSALLIAALFLSVQISIADFRRRIIPDVYLFPLMLIGLLVISFFPWISTISDSVITAAVGYGIGISVGFIFEKLSHKKNQSSPIGLGDIKLIATGGIWLGSTGLAIAIVISCLLGIIWGLKHKQKYIPFAPFFLTGGILALIGLWFLI